MLFNKLTCREVTSVEDLERLREPWEELYRACAYPSLFCTWEWAWHWWQHIGSRDQLKHQMLVVIVTDAHGGVVGIAPFYYPTRTGKSGWFSPLRLLRPFGAPLRCRIENLTEEPILLLRQGAEETALRAIVAHFQQRSSFSWDLTQISVVQRRDAVNLLTLWKQSGFQWSWPYYRSLAGQFVTLPASWPSLEASLGRSTRRNLNRYPRHLSRDGHAWTIRTAKTPDEVAVVIDTLIHLHRLRARSNQGVEHSNHIPSQQFEACFRDTILALAAQNRATITVLEVDGVIIAAQSVLEYGSMITFYYSGFDPTWHGYSPITILSAYIMEDAIARGLSLVNFSPGEAPWKARWRTTHVYRVDELYWISILPRPILATLSRYFKRRLGSSCECGFCKIPVFPTDDVEMTEKNKRGRFFFCGVALFLQNHLIFLSRDSTITSLFG